MIAWAKAIHITALILWCAGLLMLPTIYARRTGLTGEPLHELHRLARVVFINVTSPAALVAIGAGTLLIFLRDVFTVWMVLKLLAVGALVGLHLRLGHILRSVFEPGCRYARWRQSLATGTTATVITVVLVLVLAKPAIDAAAFPESMQRPGGLQSLLETLMAIP